MTHFYPNVVVDDLRNFREATPAVMLRTSPAALDWFNENQNAHVGTLWLDHDLGMLDGRDDTTMSVVDWLSERAFNDEPFNVDTIKVHTSNPVGARNIVASLQRYGYNVEKVQAAIYFIV